MSQQSEDGQKRGEAEAPTRAAALMQEDLLTQGASLRRAAVEQAALTRGALQEQTHVAARALARGAAAGQGKIAKARSRAHSSGPEGI